MQTSQANGRDAWGTRLGFILAAVGFDRLPVSGATLGEALEAAYRAHPRLRHHLAQDSGELRPHVLCLLNGENVPRDEIATTPLHDGDELLLHQAISGG